MQSKFNLRDWGDAVADPNVCLTSVQKNSDVEGEELVSSSAEVYVKTVEAMEVQKQLYVSEVPYRLPPMQIFSSDILYRLSTDFGEEQML